MFTISGTVRDSTSQSPLPQATVFEPQSKTGTYTDNNGKYSLRLPEGKHKITFSFVGYASREIDVVLISDQKLEVSLAVSASTLDEVVITEDAQEQVLASPQMGLERLSAEQIRQLPAIFGEVDVLKVLQFLPGIKVGVEGTAGFFVRGGSNDQNQILLDNTLLYNPVHLGGLFGVFNPDVIQGVDVYKGNFPARYGGRLSSVLDVQMRTPRQDKFHISGGLGLISSRLATDIPLHKEKKDSLDPADSLVQYKGGLLLAARRTYIDVFTRSLNTANADNPNATRLPNYAFTDLNARYDLRLNGTDRLSVMGFYGNDNIVFKDTLFDFNFGWSNSAASVRWQRVTSKGRILDVQTSFSQYDYRIRTDLGLFTAELRSRVRDFNTSARWEEPIGKTHRLQTGIQYTFHQFYPNLLEARGDVAELRFSFRQVLTGSQAAVWIGDLWRPSRRWAFDYGLRFSGWAGMNSLYGGIEPRAGGNFRLTDALSLKAGYARTFQYQHLAASSSISLPTDIWYPSTEFLKPQRADLVSAGWVWAWKSLGLTTTVESYYKWLNNVVELRPAAFIFVNPDLDKDLLQGQGTSYGLEFQIEKQLGKTSGWISYTLSRSDRQFTGREGFDLLNGGRPFPFRFDRRHDLSIVLVQQIVKRLSLSLAFVYRTGEAISVPTGRTVFRDLDGINRVGFFTDSLTGQTSFDLGESIALYDSRNNFRMPDYHRMDISVTWQFRPKRGKSELVFSVYNVYNRANPFVLVFDEVKDVNLATIGFRGRIISLFPALPAISWNFSF